MLKYFSSTQDFRFHLKSEKNNLSYDQLHRLDSSSFRSAFHKMWKLDADLVYDILQPLYSSTGRPAIDPTILIRSFILMQHLNYLSIDSWCDQLRNDKLLLYLIGADSPPSSSSHYDFISRLTGIHSHMNELYPKDHYKKPDKPKPKKNEKLINYSHTDTYYLFDKYKNGAEADRERMIYTLQLIMNALVVLPSADMGFIDSHNLTLSGDGSSLHIHASQYGHHVILPDDPDKEMYRFTAPNADIGWDSDLGTYYLGFTLYNISYHNPLKNIDLPVFVSLEKASRHDALSTISCTAQFLDICSDLHPAQMCFDSASDSLPIYQYLRSANIIPFIDRNKRRTSKEKEDGLKLTDDDIPICKKGIAMVDYGYDIQRSRRKFRCPFVLSKTDSCPFKDECSKSKYGKVLYINDGDDIRYGGPVRYRSDAWKKVYNNRTSTERTNNRILNEYHLHQMKIRGEAKQAFFSIFAAINIHLDAWVKE